MCTMNSKNLWNSKTKNSERILSSLGLKTPLSKLPLKGDIFFKDIKKNQIINTFL